MNSPSLLIDVRSILESLGETIELDVDVALPTLALGSEEFVPTGDARLVGSMTNTGAGVVLSATLDVSLRAECCRCLKEFVLPVSVRVDGFYVAHGSERDLPAEQEVGFIDSGGVDIMHAIVSALTLELPYAPVHDEDCRGICPTCGVDRNDATCGCAPEFVSSPFSGLKDLFPSDE